MMQDGIQSINCWDVGPPGAAESNPVTRSRGEALRRYAVSASFGYALELARLRWEIRSTHPPASRPPVSWYLRRGFVRGTLTGIVGAGLYQAGSAWWARNAISRGAHAQ
ncbi:hypothetical protein PENSPDRAFT_646974 [Peniophora sp. CONT]|nr:hypothetical protein PENSPDRAFT_646974 [Peniophora sp. CONT]